MIPSLARQPHDQPLIQCTMSHSCRWCCLCDIHDGVVMMSLLLLMHGRLPLHLLHSLSDSVQLLAQDVERGQHDGHARQHACALHLEDELILPPPPSNRL